MNENEAREAIDRAAEAKRILEHPLFSAAVTDVRAAVLATWAGTKLSEAPAREQLWLMDQQMTRLLRALRTHIETGKVAEATLLRDKPKWRFGT